MKLFTDFDLSGDKLVVLVVALITINRLVAPLGRPANQTT
jgi:hypothetical protein